jgi:Tfp pilus assembly protein PilF
MRWCLDRWRGRAALLALFCAFVAAPAFAGPDDGPKKNDPTKPEEKNPLIEDAGKRLVEGKVDEAYDLLKQAVAKKADLPPARLMMFRLMARPEISRQYQQRLRAVLELAVQENPNHPLVYLDNAQIALQEGRVTDAILSSEKALALGTTGGNWTPEQKKDIEVVGRQYLAQAFEARGKWEDARSQLDALIKKDPTNPQYHFHLARAMFFLDKPKDAEEELKVMAKNDKNANLGSPEVAMAKLWSQKGENPNARTWFEKAIKAEPNNVHVQVAYADWLCQQNEWPEAKLHIDAAAKIKADDIEVQKFQGLIARAQKDNPKAEQVLKQILITLPDDFFTRDNLALALVDQTSDPKVVEQKQKQAKEHAELNAKANQKSPVAFATLGYVYYQLKQLDGALQCLQQALNLSNGQMSPDTGYFLALCWKDARPEDAKKILREILLPNRGMFVYSREARDLLAQLEKNPRPTGTSSR